MKKLSIKKVAKAVLFSVIVLIICILSVLASIYLGMSVGSAAFALFLTEDSLALAYVCMISGAAGTALTVFYVGKLAMLIIRKIKEVIFIENKQ